MMPHLNDRELREMLIRKLSSASNSPSKIIEELRVHNGNAIADVVAIYKNAHCYEIKGDADNLQRIENQSKYYDLAFKKITLVTTDRHVRAAATAIPQHWGIIVAKKTNETPRLVYVRPARTSPSFDRRLALLTLWKSELDSIAVTLNLEKTAKLSREKLSAIIADNLGERRLEQEISNQLASRDIKQQNR